MMAPAPDELVEALFAEVLLPPEGYEYHGNQGQLLFPVYGNDQWRVLLHKKDTDFIDTANFYPVFLDGDFVRKLTKALHAMQRELNQAVSDEIPELNRKMETETVQ